MDARIEDARAFLQEAVYRSRGRQAGAGLWAVGDPSAADCGLGAKAAVVLDLAPEGERLFERLWPAPLEPVALVRVRAVMAAWITRQDALDRDRNHFLKRFRREHGFGREQYTPEQSAAYEAGLDEVNQRVRAELERAAQELLAAGNSRTHETPDPRARGAAAPESR